MAGEQLKTFMIGLGFQVDAAGMAKIEAFAKSTENYARQMTESVNKLTKAIEQSTHANMQHVESHRKMHETWKIGKEAVLGFVGALTALAVTGEEAVRRVSREFSNLYYMAQRTGVSAKGIETLRFQFEKIGLSVEQADSAIGGLASRMRSQPGLITQITGWVGPIKNAGDAILKLGKEYQKVIAIHGEFSAGEAQFRSVLESMGLDPDQILQVAKNIGVVSQAATRFKDIIKKLGYGDGEKELQRLQEKSVEFQRGWVDFRWVVGKVWEGFAGALMPGMTRLLGVFVDSISNVSGGFEELEKQFTDFINEFVGPDGEKGKQWFRDVWTQLRNIGTEIAKIDFVGLAKAIGKIAEAIIWVANELGPIPTLLLAAFGPAIISGIFSGITAGIIGGFTGLGTSAGAAFAAGFVAGLPALILGALGLGESAISERMGVPNPSARRAEELDTSRGHAKSGKGFREGSPIARFFDWIGGGGDNKEFTAPIPPVGHAQGGIVGINAHAGEAVLPVSLTNMLLRAANQPQPFNAARGQDSVTEVLDRLANDFNQWWSGSASFNPIVQLASDFYDKLRDVLESLGFTVGGGGVAGGALGEAPARPTGAAPGSGGRAPGRISPDGAPTPGTPIEGQWYTGSAPARQAEHGGFNYAGIRAPASMGGLTYPSEFARVADTARLLQNYAKGGHDTLGKIINRWAPPNENNTGLLLKRAQEWSGIDLNQKLDLTNPEQLSKVLDVMNRNEFGGKRTITPENLQGYTKRFLGGEKPAGGFGGDLPGVGEAPTSDPHNVMSGLVDKALKMKGMDINNPTLRQFVKTGAGMDPKYVAWCAAFVNSLVGSVGGKKGSNIASSMMNWGHEVGIDQMMKGDIGVALHGSVGQTGSHAVFMTGRKMIQAGRMMVETVGREHNQVMTRWRSLADMHFRRANEGDFPRGTNLGTENRQMDRNLGSEKPAWRNERRADNGDYGGGNDDRQVVHKSETTINVVGAADPHGTAAATRDLIDRRSPLQMRGRKTALA